MNAVNLIPGDTRRRRVSVSASPATLGLIGGLVAVLVAAVLYVTAANDVTARKSELARVMASVSSWQATANSYASLVESAQQRDQQLGAVRQLAATRFPWSQLLSQVGGLMPAGAALSSLQATTSTPGGPTSTTGSASAVTTTSAPPSPTVQLSGCARSQSTVARAMVQLHRISGVTAVVLASATDSSASSSGAAAGSAAQTGGCPFPVSFQVALTFSAPASTAPTATPTASAVTTTTGASR